jgi:hypothetical protein
MQGFFDSSESLQDADFEAPATSTAFTTIPNVLASGWYATDGGDFSMINLLGPTQFRLRFDLQDNGDSGDDFLKLYSGTPAPKKRSLVLHRRSPQPRGDAMVWAVVTLRLVQMHRCSVS